MWSLQYCGQDKSHKKSKKKSLKIHELIIHKVVKTPAQTDEPLKSYKQKTGNYLHPSQCNKIEYIPFFDMQNQNPLWVWEEMHAAVLILHVKKG